MNFMNDIDSWLGMQNPANGAQGYLNQIPGMMQGYYNPYIQAGQQALPQLQQQFGMLTNNPGAVMNKIGSGFQQSPGYNWQVKQSMNAANNAAAAGGMLGSPAEQQSAATAVNGLANQDYYNYLNHGMNMYDTGLQGLQGMNQMGFNASTGLANNLANVMQSQANLSYAGQSNQNQMNGGLFGAGLGFLGSVAGGLMGGPGGAMAGGGIGSGIGNLFGGGSSGGLNAQNYMGAFNGNNQNGMGMYNGGFGGFNPQNYMGMFNGAGGM
jgi:hypothetical protein